MLLSSRADDSPAHGPALNGAVLVAGRSLRSRWQRENPPAPPLGSRCVFTLDRRGAEWVNRLAAGFEREDLETTARVLQALCRQLEQLVTTDGMSDSRQRAGHK